MTLLRNAAETSSDEDGWAHLAAPATSPSGRAAVARSQAGGILLKLALTAMAMSSVRVVTNTQRPRRFRTDTTAAA